MRAWMCIVGLSGALAALGSGCNEKVEPAPDRPAPAAQTEQGGPAAPAAAAPGAAERPADPAAPSQPAEAQPPAAPQKPAEAQAAAPKAPAAPADRPGAAPAPPEPPAAPKAPDAPAPAIEPQPPAPPAPTALAPTAPEPAPAKAALAGPGDARFSVYMQPAKAKVGQPGQVQVVLVPKGEFHCNDQYPYKVKLDAPPPGVSYPEAVVRRASMSVSPGRTVARVPFVASEPGAKKISGSFSFSVCTDTQCVIETRAVSATVQVE